MEATTILLLVSGTVAAGYFLRSYLQEAGKKRELKREQEREHRALNEYMSNVCGTAGDGLKKLNNFKASELPKFKADVSTQVRACIQERIVTANVKIASIMDSKFYGMAARACLPSKQWKAEFQDAIKAMEREIVDQQALGKDLERITKDVENKVRTSLLSILDTIQIDDQNLSDETKATLNRFKDNPDKMIQLLGKNTELNSLINLNMTRDAAIGLSLFGSGFVFHFASEALDVKTIAALSGGAMRDMFGSEILKQATIAISNWIVQEVGEQVFAEVMEALAALATGIGALFTAWKVVKYGRLAHRLFIAQEPLEKMRASVRENLKTSLDNVGNSVEESINKQIDAWISEIEASLKKIIKEATFQEIRSRSYFESQGAKTQSKVAFA